MTDLRTLTDEELKARIDKFQTAIDEAALGGVGRVTGEGRTMEMFKGDTALAERLLDASRREWDRRYPCTDGTATRGRAIGLSFPRW